ncbi:MAG: hypothetical protein ACI4S4_00630 [Candidatus Ornithospirochaeta sp.]
MKKSRNLWTILLISILVFFLGLWSASWVESSGGKVDVDRLSVTTDGGYVLSLKMFRPKSATSENPAPAILLVPGGNACVEYMSDVAIELARRGYVAVGVEPYTIGRSDLAPSTKDLGTTPAYYYVRELDFVDSEKIGLLGWSMGASRTTATLYDADKNIRPGIKAIMFVGAGAPLSMDVPVNSALYEGTYDFAYGRGVDKRSDMAVNPTYTKILGVDKFEFNKWYGDPSDGSGRIIYEGFAGHISGLSSKSMCLSACDFFSKALAPISTNVSGTTFQIKEISTAVSFVAIVVAMICLALILADAPFFSDIRKEEIIELRCRPSSWTVWVGLAATALFGALIAKWAIFTGQTLLNKTKVLQIQNVNGLVFWLILLQVFGLALFIVFSLFVTKTDKNALKRHASISGKALGKSVLLGTIVIVATYLTVSLGEQIFCVSPRLWKVMMNSLTPKRFALFLIYLPCYLIPFVVAHYIQSASYDCGESKLTYLLMWAANALPPMFFIAYVYGKLAFTGLTAITGLQMSRANGSLLDACIMMVPVGVIEASLFRKTKNHYVPAVLNAMLFTWMAVGTDLITWLG